jgi:hypothetical protein
LTYYYKGSVCHWQGGSRRLWHKAIPRSLAPRDLCSPATLECRPLGTETTWQTINAIKRMHASCLELCVLHRDLSTTPPPRAWSSLVVFDRSRYWSIQLTGVVRSCSLLSICKTYIVQGADEGSVWQLLHLRCQTIICIRCKLHREVGGMTSQYLHSCAGAWTAIRLLEWYLCGCMLPLECVAAPIDRVLPFVRSAALAPPFRYQVQWRRQSAPLHRNCHNVVQGLEEAIPGEGRKSVAEGLRTKFPQAVWLSGGGLHQPQATLHFDWRLVDDATWLSSLQVGAHCSPSWQAHRLISCHGCHGRSIETTEKGRTLSGGTAL